ncbi:MAG: hypothetical protein ABSE00_10340 [Chitinispirillaceae bacterium]|jgi:hypothetical protein
MKRFVVLAVVACGLLSASTYAQSQKNLRWTGSDGWGIGTNYEQLFNNFNLTVFTGTVFSEDTVTPMNGMGVGVEIFVKDPNGVLFQVHLGPRWFIVHQDMTLEIGDQVEVHAARFTCNGKDTYAAFYIIGPDHGLYLRDPETGWPYWCGWQKRRL